jgi:hypothetical protein
MENKMKKLVCLIAVLALTAPVMADITFTATNNGDCTFTIGFTADPCTLPVGFGLIVDADPCQLVSYDSGDSFFDIYIDFASDDPCAYTLGAGHPVAKVAEAGSLTLPANTAALCMGILSESAPPASSTNLATLTINAAGTVTISADPLRGGVVDQNGDPIASNLPITVDVTCGVTWPACWDFPNQCYGDATGDGATDTNDWPAFRDSFFKSYPDAAYNPCGDFNRDGTVDTNDWPFFRDNFFKSLPGDCTPGGVWPPL